MFAAGCLLSWTVVGVDPMPRRPRYGVRVATLVVAAAAHDTVSKLLYARGLPAGAGPVLDRQAGAELMYYGGTLTDVALTVALMAQWYRATGREYRRMQRRLGTRLTDVPRRS
jgi:putative membrane protein